MVVLQPDGESPDVGRISLIEREIFDSRIRLGDLLEQFDASAGDDHIVAQSVKCFSQAAADTRAASGDQDGVARQLHALSLSVAV